MAAETYAAAISAGGSIINGILGYKAADAAMAQEAQEARRNREFQEKMYNLQIQDQERLYNQYATPMAQRKMYEQAGLNPNLMLKNGNQVPGSPIQSGPSPSGAVGRGFTYNPNIDLSGFQGAFLREAQRENLQASTDAQQIKNRFAALQEIFTLREKLAKADKDSSDARFLRQQLREAELNYKYQEDMLQARNDLAREDINYRAQQARLTGLQADNQEIVNYYAPQLNEATLKQINSAAAAAYAEAAQAYADAGYKGQLSKSEIIKRTLMRAEKEGIKLSNDEQRIVNNYLDEQIRLGISSMQKHVRQQGQDYWNPFRYAGQILGGAAAGSMAAGIKNTGSRTVVRGFVP